MKFTLTQLKSIVDTHNRHSLALFNGPIVLPPGLADVHSILPGYSLGSWKGILSLRHVPTYDLARSALGLNSSGKTASVFSVIHDTGLLDFNDSKELPVVVCVGINYIQKPTYTRRIKLVDDTGMHAITSQVISEVIGKPSGDFQLVAANFFPWVTVGTWAKATGTAFNALHEMLLLETCGFDDPVSHVRSLAEVLRPKWLIFHGVDNCVPSLGNTVRKLLRREAIFCDNISRRYMGKNVIRF